MLLVIVDLALAMLAYVDSFLRVPFGPTDLGELENLILIAAGAWNPVVALIAVLKARFNPAAARDLRRRDHEHFSPRERSGSRQREIDRVAFAVDIAGIRVNLVKEEIAGRHGAQTNGAVRPGHDKNAAGKFFRE